MWFYYMNAIVPPRSLGKITTKFKQTANKLREKNNNYSFLSNCTELLVKEKNIGHMYDYIHLASLRSLFDYNIRGVYWVYTWQIPKQIDYINNPLVRIEEDKVFLKYETAKQR